MVRGERLHQGRLILRTPASAKRSSFCPKFGRADQNRLLVLRSASDYTIQPQGQNPAQFLASENSGGVSGFQEARRSQCNIRPWVLKAAPRLRSV